jgi:hypothetical protein
VLPLRARAGETVVPLVGTWFNATSAAICGAACACARRCRWLAAGPRDRRRGRPGRGSPGGRPTAGARCASAGPLRAWRVVGIVDRGGEEEDTDLRAARSSRSAGAKSDSSCAPRWRPSPAGAPPRVDPPR